MLQLACKLTLIVLNVKSDGLLDLSVTDLTLQTDTETDAGDLYFVEILLLINYLKSI